MTDHRKEGKKRRLFSSRRQSAGERRFPSLTAFSFAGLRGNPSSLKRGAAARRPGGAEHQHGPDAAMARLGSRGFPRGSCPEPERRRGPEPGHRLQDEERHRVGAAVSEGERPEHHAQSVGLRAQAAVLGEERLSRGRGGRGRPGKHRAAIFRAG